MSDQGAGQILSRRIAAVAVIVFAWTATAIAVEFSPCGTDVVCPCTPLDALPPVDDVGSDWGAMCGLAIASAQRCEWRPHEDVTFLDGTLGSDEPDCLPAHDESSDRSVAALRARLTAGSDADYNYHGTLGDDAWSGDALLAVAAACGRGDLLARLWVNDDEKIADDRPFDAPRVVVGKLTEIVNRTEHSAGLAVVDELNHLNEGVHAPAGPAAIVRQQPTYTWYSFFRSAWDGERGLEYGDVDSASRFDTPVRVEAEALYASKPAMRIGTVEHRPLERFDTIIDGKSRYLFLRKTDAGSRAAVIAPSIDRRECGDSSAPGKAPKVNGANHDESDKSAHAAAAKAAWIEPQASLQRSFSDDPFADGGWYDEVMSASSAASRQTTQNNDYQPPKSPAARLVARSAAEFAGWAGTAFTVLAGRLIEMSDAAAGSSDAAAPGLRTANPADPDRLSSRLGSRSSP